MQAMEIYKEHKIDFLTGKSLHGSSQRTDSSGRHFASFPTKLNNPFFFFLIRDSYRRKCSLLRDSSTRKCLPYLDLLSLKNEEVISGQSSWALFFRGMSLQHGSLY